MSTLVGSHIRIDDRGVAWIDDTNVKVIEVALDVVAHGLAPQEIEAEHYGHLTLAQIHAALTWYYDHQQQFDEEIDRQYERARQLRAATLDSPGRRKLKALGKRP